MASIQDIEMFVAVVEAGSLSAAAQRLTRTQPTVSRQLAALEARLGARLIERTTRKLRLTAAGRAYFERCTAIVAMAREADAAVADTHRSMAGVIRLSVPPTYARVRIAPLLPSFLEAHPEVRLEMVLTSALDDVVAEPLDLVVRLGRLPDSTLACQLLSHEHFVLCAAPAYSKRHGAPQSVHDLATRKCLVSETFGLRSRWVFRGRPAVEVRGSVVSDDLALLHEAARHGLGIAALPSYLVADDLRSGTLTRVLPREHLPTFTAHALLPSGRHVSRRVRALVDHLASKLRRAGTKLGREQRAADAR